MQDTCKSGFGNFKPSSKQWALSLAAAPCFGLALWLEADRSAERIRLCVPFAGIPAGQDMYRTTGPKMQGKWGLNACRQTVLTVFLRLWLLNVERHRQNTG